jgi:hypothetical protein
MLAINLRKAGNQVCIELGDPLRPEPYQVVSVADGCLDERPNIDPEAVRLEGQEVADP